jgi:adenosylcobinamide-GDP ribazoletransferase
MTRLRGLITAFSMYSAIPVPHIAWEEGGLRRTLACFPLVGAAIGGLFWLWLRLAALWSLGDPLRAAGALAVSLGISGGIHLDGLCDTLDALASRREREQRLRILKDPHIGAFAAIGCGMYLLLYFSLLCELATTPRTAGVLAVGFVVSRAASAAAAVTLPAADRGGTLAQFADLADRRVVLVSAAVYLSACALAMLLLDWLCGGLCLLAAGFCFLLYRTTALRQFGGITGDLAGWFVCLCEAAFALAAVAAQLLRGGAA